MKNNFGSTRNNLIYLELAINNTLFARNTKIRDALPF